MKRQTSGSSIIPVLGWFAIALVLGLPGALPAQTSYTILKSFGFPQLSTGGSPNSWLVESGGKLYGTAFTAGSNGLGAVFSVNKDGSGYTMLHSFAGGTNDGANPQAGLLVGIDGALYGTCTTGGSNQYGTVFKLNPDGSGYRLLHTMGSIADDAELPYGGLIQGQDNQLYGTGYGGGTNGSGAIYRLDTNGTSYALVYSLGYDGDAPYGFYSGVMQGRDGALYGATPGGGTNGSGEVFRVNTNGSGFMALHEFSGRDDGGYPRAGLVQGQDGALYGTTTDGGTNDYGTIFKINAHGGNFTVLHSCGLTPDAYYIYGAMIQGTNGLLYGTSEAGGSGNWGSLFEISTDGVTFAVIHNMYGPPVGGEHPQASLFQADDGRFYGTTQQGGTNANGTLFGLNSDGSGYTEFFNFNGNGGDANEPEASLLLGKDGALYGTSYLGGSNGVGAIFKVNRDGGGYRVLYSFGAFSEDGTFPDAGLVQAANGMLFGATRNGGTNSSGTVFTISTNGQNYSLLVAPDNSIGYIFNAAPIIGMDGGLYGTTSYGGSNFSGTIYRMDQNGQNYTLLHTFPSDPSDGENPQSGLIQGPDGTLYGTTYNGGTNDSGTVFRLDTNGNGYAVLHQFPADANDGSSPYGGLAQGPDGTLYGTTSGGTTNYAGSVFKLGTNGSAYVQLVVFDYVNGAYPEGDLKWIGTGLFGTTSRSGLNGNGTVFTVDTNGNNLVTLHGFAGPPGDGAYPWSGVEAGNDGAIYGTTTAGGTTSYGAVYKLSSAAQIEQFQYVPHTGAVVTVTSLPGQMFHLEAATNLGSPSWTNMATNVIGAGGTAVITDPDATNRATKFYRAATP